MNDHELLELAAKACGYTPDGSFGKGLIVVVNVGMQDKRGFAFDPGNDDGDCARMEAALGIDIEWWEVGVVAKKVYGLINRVDDVSRQTFTEHNGDKQAARRMASLRVAAEIGKAMP